jgi:hypothetical protein
VRSLFLITGLLAAIAIGFVFGIVEVWIGIGLVLLFPLIRGFFVGTSTTYLANHFKLKKKKVIAVFAVFFALMSSLVMSLMLYQDVQSSLIDFWAEEEGVSRKEFLANYEIDFNYLYFLQTNPEVGVELGFRSGSGFHITGFWYYLLSLIETWLLCYSSYKFALGEHL